MSDEWPILPLGDAASRVTAKTRVEPELEYRALGVYRDGAGLFEKDPFVGGETTYKTLTEVRQGQLVLRSITAWEAPIAVAGPEHDGLYVSSVFPVFELDSQQLLPSFMGLVCQWPRFWEAMRERSTGTVLRRKTLSADALLSIPVPVPPLKEQRRIVDIISSIDAAIESMRGLHAAQTSTQQALLNEGLARAPKTELLGEMLVGIDAGKSPVAEDRLPEEGELAVLKVSAVRPGYFAPEQVKVISDTDGFPKHAKVKKGDLLITRANTRELVGSVCRVESVPPDYYLSDKTLRLRVDETAVSPEYVLYSLQSREARRQIENAATGTSGSMKNISQASIRGLSIPVLEMEEQARWAETQASFQSAASASQATLQALALLRRAVLSDLISGSSEVPDSYDRFLEEAS